MQDRYVSSIAIMLTRRSYMPMMHMAYSQVSLPAFHPRTMLT